MTRSMKLQGRAKNSSENFGEVWLQRMQAEAEVDKFLARVDAKYNSGDPFTHQGLGGR
jgi:hypothetical protein